MREDVTDYLKQILTSRTDLLLLVLLVSIFSVLVIFYFSKVRKKQQSTIRVNKKDKGPLKDKKEIPKSSLSSLQLGLSKTRTALQNSLKTIFSGQEKIDLETLDKIHELLYKSDIGVKITSELIQELKAKSLGQTASWQDILTVLREKSEEIFKLEAAPISCPSSGPLVILIVGVNGVGKTTSVGKLGSYFTKQGKSVLFGAADTFRAAAIDQLKLWGERLHIDTIAQNQGSDPAAVAFDTCKAAVARKKEVVLIDTAGRLHNKIDLMGELSKIKRVIQKEIPEAPHQTWLVIDSTTGQNARTQVKAFSEATPLTGIIATKLDGTAKGGVLMSIVEEFKIPVRFIGVGEKAEDLQPFEARDFTKAIFS